MAEMKFNWVDNPTVSGIAECNTDVLNDCLMHLKYDKSGSGLDDKITNCITEKPKYLNWTYADGVITLKAGSKLMYPDGFNSDGSRKFSYYTTTKDFVWDHKSTTASLRYFWVSRGLQYVSNFHQSMLYVGDTAPALTNNYCLWYDTANNILKDTADKGVTWRTDNGVFPIMTVQQQADEAGYAYPTSVFDGIGIMDKCAWVADGVKVLIPNGRNSDGTLKNIEVTTKACIVPATWNISVPNQASLIITSTGLISTGGLQYVESEAEPTSTYTLWYNPLTNEMKYKGASTSAWEKRLYMRIGSCAGTYGTLWADHFSFTEPNFKEAFRGVDFNEFIKLEEEFSELNTNALLDSDKSTIAKWAFPTSSKTQSFTPGASGATYTMPADGWLYARATGTSADIGKYMNISNNTLGFTVTGYTNFDAPSSAIIPVRAGDTVAIHYLQMTLRTVKLYYSLGGV